MDGGLEGSSDGLDGRCGRNGLDGQNGLDEAAEGPSKQRDEAVDGPSERRDEAVEGPSERRDEAADGPSGRGDEAADGSSRWYSLIRESFRAKRKRAGLGMRRLIFRAGIFSQGKDGRRME